MSYKRLLPQVWVELKKSLYFDDSTWQIKQLEIHSISSLNKNKFLFLYSSQVEDLLFKC
jgi:hypothetical protein